MLSVNIVKAGARKIPTLNLCNFIRNASKVPEKPIVHKLFSSDQTDVELEFDGKLLESLSLIDLDSEKTVNALKSSIQFANKIELIETSDDIEPLYTVLEKQNLYLRPDKVTEPNQREAVLENAKVTEEDYYVAPPGNIPLEFEKPAK